MLWSEGYAARTAYTYGYYRPLNPVFARFALRGAGFTAPAIRTACELGFGQGVSVALHAAASGAAWWGTDFMPDQAAFAQALAGDEARLCDEGFAEFCTRPDLPEFDFVCAHGIWSWISPQNRRVLVDFLKRKLRPGGVFHVSYNTATGWASLLPLRHLLLRHIEVMSPAGLGPAAALERALPFAERVFEARSVYAGQNPLAPAMLRKMSETGGAYMTHEYLGQHWNLMNVADVAQELGEAKLAYACSASVLERVPALALLAEQRALLDDIPDPGFRETVRDVLTGERFRRDYWVKGARRLAPAEHDAAARALRYVLIEPPEAVERVRPVTPMGEVELPRVLFAPLLDVLADFAPHGLDEIAGAVAGRGIGIEDVHRALLVLCHVGAVQPAHDDDAAIERVEGAVRRVNDRVLTRARFGGEIGHLANPVTGGATEVPRVQQLFLLAERDGLAAPEEWARYAAAAFGDTGSGSEALAREAHAFAAGRRRVLRAQHVA